MTSGQIGQKICVLIVKLMRNKMKEIINVYPKGVWAGNIFCLVIGLAVILFV
jgi:hypothetical protein